MSSWTRQGLHAMLFFCAAVQASPGWGGDCDLHVTGIGNIAKMPWTLDGLYLNCGSQSGAPWGASTNYCLSTGDSQYLVQMEYCSVESGQYGACSSPGGNWTMNGWAVTGFNATSSARTSARAVFAKCQTEECQNAHTPENLSGKGWMISSDNGKTFQPVTSLTSSCCDSAPASCGDHGSHKACQVSDCKDKYKTFWSCLAASTVGCCQAFGWIDNGVCLCKNTRPSCKPLDDTLLYTNNSRHLWPHDGFPLPWEIRSIAEQAHD